MISSRIKVFSRFPEFTREVEALAIEAVETGAREAARVAEQLAAPGLKGRARMTVIPAQGDIDGYVAGIRSDAASAKGVPIARFHDRGTYGNFEGQLTRARRGRARNVPDVDPDTGERTGIAALGFFKAGRSAGRKAMRRTIERGL